MILIDQFDYLLYIIILFRQLSTYFMQSYANICLIAV